MLSRITLTTSRYIGPDLIIFVQLHPSCIFMSPHERSVPGSASHIVECDKGSLSRSPVAFSTKGHLAVSSIPAAEWGWVSEQIRWKLKAASKVDERINYDQLEHGNLWKFDEFCKFMSWKVFCEIWIKILRDHSLLLVQAAVNLSMELMMAKDRSADQVFWASFSMTCCFTQHVIIWSYSDSLVSISPLIDAAIRDIGGFAMSAQTRHGRFKDLQPVLSSFSHTELIHGGT